MTQSPAPASLEQHLSEEMFQGKPVPWQTMWYQATTEVDIVLEKEKPRYMRVKGHETIIIVDSDLEMSCYTHAAPIEVHTIHAPVWNGPFPCSGSGEVETTYLPYCPTCEPEYKK